MYRLREQFGLTLIPRFTSISDEDLQGIVSLLKRNLPDIGERIWLVCSAYFKFMYQEGVSETQLFLAFRLGSMILYGFNY